MRLDELLTCALDIGEQMLMSGAEIARVEDSIERICRAYQAEQVHVFSITSSMLLTVRAADGETLTQTRRIRSYTTDLDRLDRLNSLSRYVCRHTPPADYIRSELRAIAARKTYPPAALCATAAMIAGALTLFFGGDAVDAAASAVIAVLVRLLQTLLQRLDANRVFESTLCAATAGALAILAVFFGLGHHEDMIIIGNIMLLIPGVVLTNSIRDMLSGDMISGLLRLSESVVLAVAIAIGFALSAALLGGMLA